MRLNSNTQRKAALIIEDEACCARVLELTIRLYGFDVLLASTCTEAAALLSQNYRHIALVLLDIMLPDESGIDFLARSRTILANIPVIIQSSESAEIIQKALDVGAYGYIHKPYIIEEISKMIKSLEINNFFDFTRGAKICA